VDFLFLFSLFKNSQQKDRLDHNHRHQRSERRVTVSRWVSVIRSVERIELPSTKQLMIWYGGRARERWFMVVPYLTPLFVPSLSGHINTSLDLSGQMGYRRANLGTHHDDTAPED
jgi:hypothetical protein